MSEWEKIFNAVECKLKVLDEKIQKKIDGVNAAVNKKLREHGFAAEGDENSAAEAQADINAEIEKNAEYLNDAKLHEITEDFLYGDSTVNMKAFLPFLSDGDISLILKKLGKSGGEFKGLKLEDIMPYSDEMEVDEIFVKFANEGRIQKEMIPFVSKECWHRIVKEYCADEDSRLEIDGIYPYLDDKDLKLLIKTYIRRRKRKNA